MPLIARIQQPPINSLDFLGPIISIALPHGRSDAVVKPPFSMVWDEGKRRGLAAKIMPVVLRHRRYFPILILRYSEL